MTSIDDYVLVAFFRLALKQEEVSQSFQSRPELEAVLRNLITKSLKNYPAAAIYDATALASRVFDILTGDGVIKSTSDPIAGTYHRIDFASLQGWRRTQLDTSEISSRAALVGHRFLRDVFDTYFSGKFDNFVLPEVPPGLPEFQIPASDRIVTLSHNQLQSVESASTTLIDVVEGEFDRWRSGTQIKNSRTIESRPRASPRPNLPSIPTVFICHNRVGRPYRKIQR